MLNTELCPIVQQKQVLHLSVQEHWTAKTEIKLRSRQDLFFQKVQQIRKTNFFHNCEVASVYDF